LDTAHHGPDYARATAARAAGARHRAETSELRDRTTHERDVLAQRRDELSLLRDQIAEDLDEETTVLDAADEAVAAQTQRLVELRARAHEIRVRAASDRARAARDRKQAARDRQQAARDREQAAYDREHAATDELTGARRRGVGLEQLENEMKRARREGDSLWAAYVDVDGLKSVNDIRGHAAGDALLRTVADGLRRHMRSYDLLVRIGGDEFLCVLPNVTLAEVRERFDRLRAELEDSAGTSVSVGFSELRDSDSPDDLIRRADTDLLARRSG
jgi:diguanylate cyclase (GGDEF)-like protein